MTELSGQAPLILGRGLIGELPAIAHPPYAVVTMADLWPSFADPLAEGAQAVLLVEHTERRGLEALLARLDGAQSIIGLGGGQAQDTAKYLAWRRRLPLFQVPTALSVNAAFGERAAVRTNGIVRYVGWTRPEAVFVDFDVIRSAPALFNHSGAADVLCYHTALFDWRLAVETGRCEPRWPWDERLASASREAMARVVNAADEIREVTDAGIEALARSLRYGGGAFAAAGWNPRHIEGAEHFIFYALELQTQRSFVHGQAVGLGILIASAMQGNDPDGIRAVVDRIGIPYTPERMGVTWDDVRAACDRLDEVIDASGLWYTIASARRVTPALFDALRGWIETPGADWVDPER